jgi:hypothetical protein
MLVEGPTERQFVTRTLAPFLAHHNIYCTPTTVTTRENPAGPNYKGGFVKYDKLIRELDRLIGDTNAYTTTLFDFYEMTGREVGDTIEEMENKLRSDVHANDRFIPYIQKFEFEALLFSSPNIAAEELSDPAKAAEMEAILEDCGEAEAVNDGENTAPSKRLKSLFSDYDKVADGPMVLDGIGIAAIRGACPRFSEWIDRLEALKI